MDELVEWRFYCPICGKLVMSVLHPVGKNAVHQPFCCNLIWQILVKPDGTDERYMMNMRDDRFLVVWEAMEL